ncbi:cytochrome c oxidase subunit II [Olivibacter sitiensis]|uniref:cytochrome c oxidase subunit II n=1 Tax=Olivibacter sitiensis TaxID=376470 RepID=UPI00068842B4|nr:cytochrome c oxidase subunit II [Olivibacter sitiensis]
MRLNRYINCKVLFSALVAVSLLWQNPALAQDTTAVDTAASEGIISSSELQEQNDSTGAAATTTGNAVASEVPAGTTAAAQSQDAANAEAEGIPAQVYNNFFYYVLLFVLLCVAVGVIGKILRVYDLSRNIQGKREGINWNKVHAVLFLISLILGMYGAYWSYVHHGGIAFKWAASEHGALLDNMFVTTTVITTIVFVLTQALLMIFSFVYRYNPKRKAFYYPHNNFIEKLWTITPAVVLTVLVLFGFFTWRSITNVPEDVVESSIQIEVTGEQFAWTVRYAGEDNKLGNHHFKLINPSNLLGLDYSDKASHDDLLSSDIVIPVNKPVHFTINSKDILHSFLIPEMRVQINAVPGMATHFQMTPTVTTREMRNKRNNPDFDYVMLCNKICGSGHYNMQKKVIVVSQQEYEDYVAGLNPFFDETAQKAFQAAQSNSDSKDIQQVAFNK